MFKSLILGLALGVFSTAAGAAELVEMDFIRAIESSGNAKAVSFLGAKYGRGAYQVSEICLQDYNDCTNSSIKPDELFDEKTCYTVARWYLETRIPRLLGHYKIPVTTRNIIWAYSAGIGNVVKGVMPEETKLYLKKYRKLGGDLNV